MSHYEAILGAGFAAIVLLMLFRFIVIPILRGNRTGIILGPEGSTLRHVRLVQRGDVVSWGGKIKGSILLKNARWHTEDRMRGWVIHRYLLIRDGDARPLYMDEKSYLAPIPISTEEFHAAISERKVVQTLNDSGFDWKLIVIFILGAVAVIGVAT